MPTADQPESTQASIQAQSTMQDTQENRPLISQSQSAQNVSDGKKIINEKNVTFAFVLSIINLVLSFFGYFLGALLLIPGIIFAIKGIKSAKKGLAITSLVLFGVSISIIAFQIIVLLGE